MLSTIIENIKKYPSAYAFAEFMRNKYYQSKRMIYFKKNIQTKLDCKKLIFGNNKYHTFFGYHDISPFSENGAVMLANRVHRNSTGEQGELIGVGYYNYSDNKEFIKIDETTAWCWQMGCRLQWLPESDNVVIYNKTIRGRYRTVAYNIKTKKEVNVYKRALYSISPNGCYGISLDFSRLQRLRPGYGYKDIPDASINNPTPTKDGLWLVDLNTDDSEMVLSIADVAAYEPHDFSDQAEHYFNHVLWSPDSKHFLFLHLLQLKNGQRSGRAFLYNSHKRELQLLETSGYISHFDWKNNDEILMYSKNNRTGTGLNLYNIANGNISKIVPELVKNDGHPMFSPANTNLVLLDSYPKKPYMERSLFFINIAVNKRFEIASFYSPPNLNKKNVAIFTPGGTDKAIRLLLILPITVEGRWLFSN